MRALRHADFRLIWLGQIARGTSQWMQVTTVPLYVLRAGGGAFELGIVAALQFLPVMVLAPLGGAAADRVPKRVVLIVAQVVLAAQALVLALTTLTATDTLLPVFVLSFVFGVANAIEMPFRQTFVAELLPASDLLNGIA
ncbi:MAG: MFS transporter, partial [Dehalococcoidia bacterium]